MKNRILISAAMVGLSAFGVARSSQATLFYYPHACVLINKSGVEVPAGHNWSPGSIYNHDTADEFAVCPLSGSDYNGGAGTTTWVINTDASAYSCSVCAKDTGSYANKWCTGMTKTGSGNATLWTLVKNMNNEGGRATEIQCWLPPNANIYSYSITPK
jgi:hypothetical protein